MTITWINCVERMPPDDNQTWIIYRLDLVPKPCKIMADHFHHLCTANGIHGREWMFFTEEAWRSLNND